MQFQKKPIKLKVYFAQSSGTIQTLEGSVMYQAGDALVTGTKNEQWPIERIKFEATYIPASEIKIGEDGWYLKKPMIVSAEQSTTKQAVKIKDGAVILNAHPGDWIVSDGFSNRWVVEKDIFNETYELIE